MHQYGLDIVINGMSHRHLVSTYRLGNLSQEIIAYLASRFLQRKAMLLTVRPDIAPLHSSRYPEPCRQFGNIAGISPGSRPPQPVVKVGDV